jgi:hypothetical protein
MRLELQKKIILSRNCRSQSVGIAFDFLKIFDFFKEGAYNSLKNKKLFLKEVNL